MAEVVEGSGAAKAGIQANDLIIQADGQSVTTYEELNAIRDKKAPNDVMRLKVIRAGEVLEIDVTLGEDKPKE